MNKTSKYRQHRID